MSPSHQKATALVENDLKRLKKRVLKNSKDYTAIFQIGVRYYMLDEFEKSLPYFKQLSDLGADQYEVYSWGVKAAMKIGNYKVSEEMARKGLERFPEKYELQGQLAMSLRHSGQYDAAEEVLKTLNIDNPDNPEPYIALGTFYLNTGKIDESLKINMEGLERFPDSKLLYNNIGALYSRINDHTKAAEHFLKALRIDPNDITCLINIGTAMEKMKKPDVARQFYEEILKLEPNNPIALCCKANLMSHTGLAQEAIPLYKEGLELMKKKPNLRDTQYITHLSNYVFYMHYAPNMPRKEILNQIHAWQEELCITCEEKPAIDFPNKVDRNKKLKVGLISGGFSIHPVGQMISAALEHLDKDKVSLYCYSDNTPDRRDYLYQLIMDQCEKVTDTFGQLNPVVLEMMREDEIDILIEMTGHSEGGRRLKLIAERAAPVQVKWVGGLFNTTGIPQMDWLLTDNIETPEGEDKWYTEKLYRMPDDYIVYKPPYYAPEVGDLPAINNGFITFGNLNNIAKTNSKSIELWSALLHRIDNSKLLLKGSKMDAPYIQEHIYTAFAGHGITKDRVIIEGGVQHKEFLDVYNRIDIALDPHPYTGGLTTCEALWMGVPVITLPGKTFAGRHAATHLTNADLEQFIAKNEKDYVDIAAKLAEDLEGLSDLRSGLREHVAKTPLVDGAKFAKNLEIALRHMWSEWCDMKEKAR